jgi:outer membrane protein TolC
VTFTAIAMVAALANGPGPASGAEVLTLDEAVALALQNSRRVAMAELDAQSAEKKVAVERTRRLPTLNVEGMAGTTLNAISITFPAGSFGTYPSTGPIPGEDAVVEAPRAVSGNLSATLAQPITQLHRIGLGVKMSELARDAEREKLREQRAAVVADVKRTYYALLQGQSALAAHEEQLAVYRELHRIVGQQMAIEVALPSDGLQVRARLAGAEQEVVALRNDLATAREQLNLLMGRDVDHAFEVAGMPPESVEEVDLGVAVAAALQRRPDLAQARLAIEQADTDRRMKKAESIPSLSLAVAYSSYINIDLLPKNIAQVGLQLKWEPFDWGRRAKERVTRELALDRARSAAGEAQAQARIEVARCFRKLQEARLLLQAERLGREAAAERLRVVTSRRKQEAALVTDALQAQADMTAAGARYDSALATYWTARADLQKAIGEEQ